MRRGEEEEGNSRLGYMGMYGGGERERVGRGGGVSQSGQGQGSLRTARCRPAGPGQQGSLDAGGEEAAFSGKEAEGRRVTEAGPGVLVA